MGWAARRGTKTPEWEESLTMKRIICEVEKCMGCRACQIACAVEHSVSKDLAQAFQEEPRPGYRVMVEYVEQMPIPLQCRHCEDAPCVQVCPTHCLTKEGDQGIVLADRDKCIGCLWCVLVCPFGAARMRKSDRVVLKCDLCFDRQKKGLQPACVSACPTHALQFREVEDVAKDKRVSAARDLLAATPSRTGAL
jgi:carbon-monoxide dehydrogenase iron sulfur subunit